MGNISYFNVLVEFFNNYYLMNIFQFRILPKTVNCLKLFVVFILISLTYSKMVDKAVYGWENRVKFIVKFMYDIDNNGR